MNFLMKRKSGKISKADAEAVKLAAERDSLLEQIKAREEELAKLADSVTAAEAEAGKRAELYDKANEAFAEAEAELGRLPNGTKCLAKLRRIKTLSGPSKARVQQELDSLAGESEELESAVAAWPEKDEAAATAKEDKRTADDVFAELRKEKAAIRARIDVAEKKEGKLVAQLEKMRSTPNKDSWAALAVPLGNGEVDGIVSTTTRTSVSNTNRFPFQPLAVGLVTLEDLLAHCEKIGFVGEMQRATSVGNLRAEFAFATKSKVFRSEFDAEAAITTKMQHVFDLLNTAEVSTKKVFAETVVCRSDTEASMTRADFFVLSEPRNVVVEDGAEEDDDGEEVDVGGGKQRRKSDEDLLVVGEVKKANYQPGSDFHERYCRAGCNVKDCQSERHKDTAPITQLFNYMVLSGVFYGLFSTHQLTVAFFRDCRGHLLVTPTMAADVTTPCTVPQLLAMVVWLAGQKLVPQLAGKDKDGNQIKLEACDAASNTCGGGHQKLPDVCARQDAAGASGAAKSKGRSKGKGKGKGGGRSATDAMETTSESSLAPADAELVPMYHLSASDIDRSKPLSRGRFGATFRTLVPESGDQGAALVDVVIKVADLSKAPELDAELHQEAKTYATLKPLQGTVVPKLVWWGYLDNGFLGALATSYSGTPVNKLRVDEPFVEAALCGLRQIHALGVLHGDVKAANLVRHPKDGRPVFIDFGFAQLCHGEDTAEFHAACSKEERQLNTCLREETNAMTK